MGSLIYHFMTEIRVPTCVCYPLCDPNGVAKLLEPFLLPSLAPSVANTKNACAFTEQLTASMCCTADGTVMVEAFFTITLFHMGKSRHWEASF